MRVEIENVRKDCTSCNFCQKGELNGYHNNLIYPYENVFTFIMSTGSGLKASICEDCLNELYATSIKLLTELDKPKP